MGSLTYRRHGIHVSINVVNDGTYGRYMIDDVLGRLHCPPDPRLLYCKAQFHAYTSFTLPDPLTGRTGTEEALHCLQSGYSQPWTPIHPQLIKNILLPIAKLTPGRVYYPDHLRRQQEIHWNRGLTTTIQHDSYLPLIESIIAKSQKLSLFTGENIDVSTEEVKCIPHLRRRGHWRRYLYERRIDSSMAPEKPVDILYDARDGMSISVRSSNVREIIGLLREAPSSIHTTHRLGHLLQQWSDIGGFTQMPVLNLNESFDMDFPSS
jgi:hypothetical protein